MDWNVIVVIALSWVLFTLWGIFLTAYLLGYIFLSYPKGYVVMRSDHGL